MFRMNCKIFVMAGVVITIATTIAAYIFYAFEKRNVASRNSFIELVRAGDVNSVSHLIENGILAKHFEHDPSPLVEAVVPCNIKMASLLVNAGAIVNVNVEGTNGYSPLMLATQARDKNCVELLLNAAADPNRAVENEIGGSSVLEFAISSPLGCNVEIVRLLIDRGADVLHRDALQSTPLMAAAETGSFDCASVLLESGATRSIPYTDNFGRTALTIALQYERESIAELLVLHGAKCVDADTALSNKSAIKSELFEKYCSGK